MEADILEELYLRHYEGAVLYCIALCGDWHLAQDIVSEAFVKAYLTLPEYVEVYASVTFPEDVSMEELQQLTYRYSQSAKFLWAPVRLGEENRFPCGIHLTEYRSERYVPNFWNDTAYPELFTDRWNWSSTDMEQHMCAMLRFCRDQYRNGTGFAPGEKESPEYYDQALNYLAENGVKAYGSYVIATPQTLLKMMDAGDVSYVYLLDAWIGI